MRPERENKNLEIYNKTADIISGVTIYSLMMSYRQCTGNNDRAIFTYYLKRVNSDLFINKSLVASGFGCGGENREQTKSVV